MTKAPSLPKPGKKICYSLDSRLARNFCKLAIIAAAWRCANLIVIFDNLSRKYVEGHYWRTIYNKEIVQNTQEHVHSLRSPSYGLVHAIALFRKNSLRRRSMERKKSCGLSATLTCRGLDATRRRSKKWKKGRRAKKQRFLRLAQDSGEQTFARNDRDRDFVLPHSISAMQ